MRIPDESLVYIAGPMTGIEDHNFPAFFAMAETLTACGYFTVNPADNDGVSLEQAIRNVKRNPLGDWAAYMRRDIPRLIDCEAVCLLDGWQASRGARLEVIVALELGITLAKWNPHTLELETI